MDVTGSVAESIIKASVEAAAPILFNKSAMYLAESLPLDLLEKILIKYHDDYGEFNYSECAKEIKARIIKQANKYGKPTRREADKGK